MAVPRRRLTIGDRAVIEVRLADGWGGRKIARALERSPGTISGEIQRHSDCAGYVAQTAQTQAVAGRSLSGRKPRLASDGALFGGVAQAVALEVVA